MPPKKTEQGMYLAPKVRIEQAVDKELDDIVYKARNRAVSKTSIVNSAVKAYLNNRSPEAIISDSEEKSIISSGDINKRAHYLLDVVLRVAIAPLVSAVLSSLEALAAASVLAIKSGNSSEFSKISDDIEIEQLKRRVE